MRSSLLALAVLALGCDSKPEPQEQAVSSLKKALTALQSKKLSEFKAKVVSDQRSGTLDLKQEITIDSKFQKPSLDLLLRMTFFVGFKDFEIKKDLSKKVDEESAEVHALLTYPEENDKSSVGGFTFVMKKNGDDWLIDMTESLDRAARINGAANIFKVTVSH